MNWLDAFFAWLFRLPRTARLAAMARTYLNGVLHDLDTHRQGTLDPATEHSLRRHCGALLFTAHTLVAAFIVCRAREITGLQVTRPHMDFHATPRRLAGRETLRKRAEELLRRLDRAEVHARKVAETLTASELEDLTGTLSTRIPREGGVSREAANGSRASANIHCPLISALSGSPPSRGTRWRGLAIRDGPALRAARTPCPQPIRAHLTLLARGGMLRLGILS